MDLVDPTSHLYEVAVCGIRTILFCAVKIASYHALLTWLVFSFVKSPFIYLPTIFSFVLGLVPFLPPWAPAALSVFVARVSYLNSDSHYNNISGNIIGIDNIDTIYKIYISIDSLMWVPPAIAVIHAWFIVGPCIYGEVPGASPWASAAAVGLGFSCFGWRGVLIGPMIAAVPYTIGVLAKMDKADDMWGVIKKTVFDDRV